MTYGVYYRQRYGTTWRLAKQFKFATQADKLVKEMIEASKRRGLDLEMLAIMRLDMHVPYGDAPSEVHEEIDDEAGVHPKRKWVERDGLLSRTVKESDAH